MLNVRAVNELDSEDIFAWRNNELTRQMSHTNALLGWEEHSQWLLAALQNENRLLLMCEETTSSAKVAIVAFDIKDKRALISVNLSPAKRGSGMGAICVKEAISVFTASQFFVETIDAEIKRVNVASRRVFEKAGFAFVREETEVLHYKLNV